MTTCAPGSPHCAQNTATALPNTERAPAQQARLQLPPLATTTIGSFPQTTDVRRARADRRAERVGETGFRQRVRGEVARGGRLAGGNGVGVLGDGEAEGHDIVQEFPG